MSTRNWLHSWKVRSRCHISPNLQNRCWHDSWIHSYARPNLAKSAFKSLEHTTCNFLLVPTCMSNKVPGVALHHKSHRSVAACLTPCIATSHNICRCFDSVPLIEYYVCCTLVYQASHISCSTGRWLTFLFAPSQSSCVVRDIWVDRLQLGGNKLMSEIENCHQTPRRFYSYPTTAG